MTPTDFLGREIKEGATVLKASVLARSPCFEQKTVTRVDGRAVYLNGWHSPVVYNDRLVVVG